jgi:hypothetical protein
MAKDTAKKNAIANATRLKIFLAITIVINVIWLIAPLSSYFGGGSADDTNNSNNEWTLFQILWTFSLWAGQEYLAYTQLYKAGQPTLDSESGKIIDCIDLSDPQQLGILSYAQDLLWVCWALQLLTQYASPKFWLLFYLIPVFAAYKIFTGFIQPMLGMAKMGAQQQQDPNQQSSSSQQEGAEDTSAKGRLNKKREELRNKGKH